MNPLRSIAETSNPQAYIFQSQDDCPINDMLPDEMILVILQHAIQPENYNSLNASSLVCRRWCRLRNDLVQFELHAILKESFTENSQEFSDFLFKLNANPKQLLRTLKLLFTGVHISECKRHLSFPIEVSAEGKLTPTETNWLNKINQILTPERHVTGNRINSIELEAGDEIILVGPFRAALNQYSRDLREGTLYFAAPAYFGFEKTILRNLLTHNIPRRDLDLMILNQDRKSLRAIAQYDKTNNPDHKPLHWGAICGTREELIEVLGRELNVNELCHRRSPLQYAVIRGDTSIIETLLRAGADPLSHRNVYGFPITPLTLAVRTQNFEAVRLLSANMDHLFDPNNSINQSLASLNRVEMVTIPLPLNNAIRSCEILEYLVESSGNRVSRVQLYYLLALSLQNPPEDNIQPSVIQYLLRKLPDLSVDELNELAITGFQHCNENEQNRSLILERLVGASTDPYPFIKLLLKYNTSVRNITAAQNVKWVQWLHEHGAHLTRNVIVRLAKNDAFYQYNPSIEPFYSYLFSQVSELTQDDIFTILRGGVTYGCLPLLKVLLPRLQNPNHLGIVKSFSGHDTPAGLSTLMSGNMSPEVRSLLIEHGVLPYVDTVARIIVTTANIFTKFVIGIPPYHFSAIFVDEEYSIASSITRWAMVAFVLAVVEFIFFYYIRTPLVSSPTIRTHLVGRPSAFVGRSISRAVTYINTPEIPRQQ